MWELDHKESWAPKNSCFWTVVLEKPLQSPLDCKEIKPVNPKGNQSWIFIGRADAEAEASVLWPPDEKNCLVGKNPYSGKDWRQEEKGLTEDEMVWWHHWLDGHDCEQTPGVGDGQVSLACCSPWGLKESDMTEQLNWTDLVMSICRVVSFVFGRECLLCPVCSLGKTLLAFALLHFVLQTWIRYDRILHQTDKNVLILIV